MPIQTETEQTSLLGEPIYDTKPENTSINESGEPIVEGTGNYFSAFFNILNTTIGAGLLALPFAFRSGIILGPLLLLLVFILANFTFNSMLYLSDLTGKFSFKEIAVKVFNKWAGIIFEATNLMFNIGGIVGYIVVIGQLGPPVVDSIMRRKTIFSSVPFFEAFIMLSIIFPLCCMKKISFLAWTSGLSITSAMYAVFAVCYRSIEKMASEGVKWSSVSLFTTDPSKIFFALPIFFFAFGSVVTLLPSYKEVKNRKFLPMFVVASGQMTVSLLFYVIMGFFGYIAFLDNTEDNILKNFVNQNDIMMNIAKVAIVIVIILSYPLLHWICRESIEEIFFSGWEFSWFRWIGEATFLCGIAYVLGVFIPKITVVFGFTGATGGSLVVFVYPSLMMAKAAKNIFLRILGVIGAIISIVLGAACTVVVILDTAGVIKPK